MSSYWNKTDEELIPILAGLQESMNNDLFPLTEGERGKIADKMGILKLILGEGNDADRLLLDTESQEHKDTMQALQEYAEANPYKVYGDRNDTFDGDGDFIEEILDAKKLEDLQEVFDEKYFSIEENVLGNYNFSDYWQEAFAEVTEGFDKPDFDILSEAMQEFEINDVPPLDLTDVMETCLRNTTAHIAAVPHLPKRQCLEAPHFEQSEDCQRECIDILNRICKFGMTYKGDKWPDATYPESFLNLMGTLDLVDIWRKANKGEFAVPNAITFGPSESDSYVFFASYNGSGSGFEPAFTRDVTMRCQFRYDPKRRYGIQKTYGFVERIWKEEHRATRIDFDTEWSDDVWATFVAKNGSRRVIKAPKGK